MKLNFQSGITILAVIALIGIIAVGASYMPTMNSNKDDNGNVNIKTYNLKYWLNRDARGIS